jgi:(p)ppGpp synthase/HD superfamily hydrolase
MLTTRFQKAFRFAARLHKDQLRKTSPVPYVSHLIAVAALVIEDGGTEDEAIAALLHDAIEDQPRGGRTARRIGTRFGPDVLRMVQACTEQVAPGQMRDASTWRARKDAYLAHIPHMDRDSRRVALADKVHNARSLLLEHDRSGDAVFERFKASRDETMWWYRALVEAFLAVEPGPLLYALDRAVTALEQRVGAGQPEARRAIEEAEKKQILEEAARQRAISEAALAAAALPAPPARRLPEPDRDATRAFGVHPRNPKKLPGRRLPG